MIRILIAEDNEEIASAISDLLKMKFGPPCVAITVAHDGEAAMNAAEYAAIKDQSFDLIISDWSMPQMTGIDFLRKVRSHPLLNRSKFILLTAVVTKAEVLQAIEAGVTGYVTKPVKAATLLAKVESVLAKGA